MFKATIINSSKVILIADAIILKLITNNTVFIKTVGPWYQVVLNLSQLQGCSIKCPTSVSI